MIAESHGHRSTPNQTKQEHIVNAYEGNRHASSVPDDNNTHEVATAERTLLAARPSAVSQREEKPDQGSRTSLRSSRSSRSLADNIRFQPSTKVYVKVDKKDTGGAAHGGGVDGNGTDGVPNQHVSVHEKGEEDVRSEEDPPSAATPSRNTFRKKEDFEHPHRKDSRKQLAESGRKNLSGQGEGRSTNPRAVQGGTENHRISDPTDHTSFSDMIRRTLERNRSSLLPKELNPSRRSTAAAAPLISLLGTADFPRAVCSQSATLSASQTSLASGKLRESSDIYDVPKSSSDWHRAMSLLSLSAIIGSGVFSPDSGKGEDDYIDMTQGLRGGSSVPDLVKVGRRVQDGERDGSNYYRVPSNKHAYINLMYPHGGQDQGVGGGSGQQQGRDKRQETSRVATKDADQPQLRPARTTAGNDGRQRRCSSSELTTQEPASCPPPSTTASLHTGGPRPPATLSRHEPVQTSMKLSPAPQLKLSPGRRQTTSAPHGNQGGIGKTAKLHQAPTDTTKSTTKAQRTRSPSDNSASYVKAERSPETARNRFDFSDGRFRGDCSGNSAEDDHRPDGGTRTSGERTPSSEDRRPRLPSVQRSPSYSRAVAGTREATEAGETEKGEQSKWFPFCMDDYVIIPTPNGSRSSSECVPVGSPESYC